MTLLRVDEVVHKFDVHIFTLEVCALAFEDVPLGFQVVAVLCDVFVAKDGCELTYSAGRRRYIPVFFCGDEYLSYGAALFTFGDDGAPAGLGDDPAYFFRGYGAE